jgi:hypothetical protein
MSKLRLYGSTSGYVELAASDVSDDGVLVLPTAAEGLLKASGGIGSNVVQTVKVNAFSTTSTSMVDVTDMTATITPTSDTSKILVIVRAPISNSLASGGSTRAQVLRDATALANTSDGQSAVDVQPDTSARTVTDFTFVHLDSPGTASAVTYKLQIRAISGTAYFGRAPALAAQSASGSVTLIEVAA